MSDNDLGAYENVEYLSDSDCENIDPANPAVPLKTSCSSILSNLNLQSLIEEEKLSNSASKNFTVHQKKYHELTLEQKNKALNLLRTKSFTSVSKLTNIPRTTLYSIKRSETRVRQGLNLKRATLKTRKRLRVSTHPQLNDQLYAWFLKKRSAHMPISDKLLGAKCQQLHKKMCSIQNCMFKASQGWIKSFKAERGLRAIAIAGEKLDANMAAVDPFLSDLEQTIINGNYNVHNIYNADETGLFFKLMPTKTLVNLNEKKAPGRKNLRNRITFMPCVNVSGSHKIPLQIIGTAANPRCFQQKGQPTQVSYFHSQKAWQTKSVFASWFHNEFVPAVVAFNRQLNQPPKALLILDNCSAHSIQDYFETEEADIKIVFLPPNVTALIQPNDMGIINAIKGMFTSYCLQAVKYNSNFFLLFLITILL